MISSSVRSPDFIGRKRELGFLLERFRAAESGSSGGIIIVTGEAGLGKSRLIAELRKKIPANGAWFAVGNCLEYIRSPYMPFQGILTQLLGRAATAAKSRGSEKMQLEHNEVSEQAKLAQFQMVLSELQRLSRVRATVLVIEDFQWIDRASAELLQYLSLYVKALRILIMVTVRTEPTLEHDNIHTLLVKLQRREANRIDLEHLSQSEVLALITRCFPGNSNMLHAGIIERIKELADGNPLYAEELLRDVLSRSDGRWEVEPALPLSLRSTIRERLRSFSPEQRNVIDQAAVIGREFDSAFLVGLTGQSIEIVYQALRKARELDILVEHERANRELSGSSVGYAFRHALTREIIYHELVAAETLRRHDRIALVLEEQLTKGTPLEGSAVHSDLISELAYHWSAAGNSGKAIAYNVRAGDAALQTSAYADAISFYNRTLHFIDRSSLHAVEIYEKLAYCCHAAGFMEDAKHWSNRAIERFERLGQLNRVPKMLLQLASAISVGDGATEEIFELLERAADLARGLADRDVYIRVAMYVARQVGYLGRWNESLEKLERIRGEIAEAASSDLKVYYNTSIGMMLANLGRIDESMAHFHNVLELSEISRDREERASEMSLCGALNDYGFVLSWLGRNDDAFAIYEWAASLAEKSDLRIMNGFVTLGCARALLRSGNLAGALGKIQLGQERGHTLAVNQFVLAEVGISVGISMDDEQLVRRVADPDVLELALTRANGERAGAVAGAFIEMYGASGDRVTPANVISRVLPHIQTAAQSWWMLSQTALYGGSKDVERAGNLLMVDAAYPHHHASRAFLCLFRSYAKARRGRDGTREAREAADIFETLGWPLYRAKALEAAGERAEATAIYRKLCAVGDLRRIDPLSKNRAGKYGKELSARESDVAGLVVQGKSNRQIAEDLNLRESTVGHYLESIFSKLGITSRTQLAVLMLDKTTGAKSAL